MTQLVYSQIQALRANNIYLTIPLDSPLMGHTEQPHTAIPKGSSHGIMVEGMRGIFCPEWGEDLEGTNYFTAEYLNCFRPVLGKAVTSRLIKKGTKCFILPPEVYSLVHTKGLTEDDFLIGILKKEALT